MRFLHGISAALVILAVGTMTGRLQSLIPRKSDATGRVYFVLLLGNDEDLSDKFGPFKTFAKASATVRPGDTIRIRPWSLPRETHCQP